jgi:hypothetical protein
VADVSLELPHYVGIELAFDTRPHAVGLGEGSGVDDLLGRLPLPCPVELDLRLVGKRVRSLLVDHRLVHPPPVEMDAD